MVEAIVEYEYIAQEPDELTIHKGEIIQNIIKKPGGWWEGTLKDKRGMFPDNFVHLIQKDNVTLRTKSSKQRQCRAVFSYHPAHDDELSLAVGDVIDVLGEVEEGWWKGRLGTNEGVFPCNFVVEIDGDKPQSKSGSKEDLANLTGENDAGTTIPNLPPKPTKIICQAKYAYEALNEDELSLREGDLITLISKTGQDRGWWRGELRGQIGVFPDNFVIILSKLEDGQLKNTNSEDTKTSNVATQRKSLEFKTNDEKNTPPIPGKKPSVPKKSPVAIGNTGALAELRQKLADMVDGAANSRISQPKEEIDFEFDQIERSAMLPDMRANRAKKPAGRRPPSVIYRETENNLVNGNTEDNDTELKPKVREWEKHKAPWVEELKLNQAKRTTPPLTPSTNDSAKLKLTPTNNEVVNSNPSPNETSKSTTKLKTPTGDVMFRTKSLISQPSTPIRPQSIHGVEPTKISPNQNVVKPPIAEKNITSPRTSLERKQADGVPLKHYLELVEKVANLEEKMNQQFGEFQECIADLKGKLQVETEMRRLLQVELEKVAQWVTQV